MFHFPKGKKELLAINGMTKEETLDYHGGLQNMLSCMSITITSKNGKKPMFYTWGMLESTSFKCLRNSSKGDV